MRLITVIPAVLLALSFSSTQATEIRRTQGGITIDGRPYTDLDGDITSASLDTSSNKIAYFVRGPRSVQGEQFTIKVLDLATNAPTPVAQAQHGDSGWLVTLAGSQRQVQAQRIWACGDGVIVSRAGLLARLHVDGQVDQISLQPGWAVFPDQLGDPCGTGYALLQGPEEHSGGLLRSLAGAPSYGFINTKSGNMVSIHLAGPTSKTAVPDLTLHVGWTLAGGVPYAAYIGSGADEAHVLNLATGKDRVVAQRTLGVGSVRFVNGADGGLNLRVGMGMEDKTFDNIPAWLDAQP
ncbi:hypothetical protein [Nitrospirillum pindoramense]|uniref:Uncharacterized protein n=1 Tax=Nitrospirillum amazonense TaxID=28077 RepID=A0A560GPF6_9PROT|nr:hypothetical protein [Nitrospirillum amazonense]TWB35895.1 hypothetical protein FBZ90_11897 [Nitrospirillum amazonense]